MEKFALGVLMGGIGGALLVANNYKMRTLVRKTQEDVQEKFDQMMDDKIRAMEKTTDEKTEQAESISSDKKSKKK